MWNETESCENQPIDPALEQGLYCPNFHDTLVCWQATAANTTVYKICDGLHTEYNLFNVGNGIQKAMAYRVCSINGTWVGKTNYNDCLAALPPWSHTTEYSAHQPALSVEAVKAMMMIHFIGSVVSLVVLIISLFIFLRFKSLQCPRTSIHKHLVVSFILRFVINTIILEPYALNHSRWYKEVEWLCRILIALQHFTVLSNFCWMLVEGLFLHLILVLRPLDNEKAPFRFFYVIGWVFPLVITTSWSIVMHFEHDIPCWNDNTQSPYIFIIYAPIMLVLVVNLLILFNLIRIVIIKLCSGHTTERRKICRTIKSTVVLVFLLGIINLLFFIRPDEQSDARIAYHYTNAILPSLQGIFVSLLYCVMNAEVRRAIKKRWLRFRESRSILRRRSSRTSMTMFHSNQNHCNGSEHAPMMELEPRKNGVNSTVV